MSLARSAIIKVGEVVLPEVIVGMIEASTTRSPVTPITRHAARADRMKNRRTHIARGALQLFFALEFRARKHLARIERCQCGRRRNPSREAKRISGDLPV